MKDQELIKINDYLIMIFREVLMIEETAIRNSDFSDVSIKEVHTLNAIGLEKDKTVSDIAHDLSITKGTASVSVQRLVDKGYIKREPDLEDRRVYRLSLTKDGKLIYRLYRKFHIDMVKSSIEGLEDDEIPILIKGLSNLYDYLNRVKADQRDEA